LLFLDGWQSIKLVTLPSQIPSILMDKHLRFPIITLTLIFGLLHTSNAIAQKGYFKLSSSDSLPFVAQVNNQYSDSMVTEYTWRHRDSEVLWVKIELPTLNKRIEKMLFIKLGKKYEYQLDANGNLTSIIQPEEEDFYKLDFKAPLFTFGEELTTNDPVTLNKLKSIPNPAPNLSLSPNLSLAECSALKETDFNDAKLFIKASAYADSRLSIAKQVAESNCITTQQLTEILGLFKHENSRLDFLMYAYDYVIDITNYGTAVNSLRYEFTRDKFLAFLKTKQNK
jgi:hypothetical protein